MNVKFYSIDPEHYSSGKTSCTIKYEARSVNEGDGKIVIKLSRANQDIWIDNNDRRVTRTTRKPRNFKNTYQSYIETLTIGVAKSLNNPLPAAIKIELKDIDGKVDFDIKDITYG